MDTIKILRCLNRKWLPKINAIKEVNNLTILDLTTLFGKLEEYEQKLTYLELHKKKEETKLKKEKVKYKEVENKYITLTTSSSRLSTYDQSYSETSDNVNSNDEEIGFFVEKDPNRISKYIIYSTCHYYCVEGHNIGKCKVVVWKV